MREGVLSSLPGHRRWHLPTRVIALSAMVGLVALVAPARLASQLRPYEPADWEIFDEDSQFTAGLGGVWLSGQLASLAGEVGTIREIGSFNAALRTGRVGLSASGTLSRMFSRGDSVAPPHGGALPDADGYRHDAGDYRIATTVRLTPAGRDELAILRFGTRLPTTDNKVGLERDQIDFFAILGGRVDRGPLRATAEAGLGIHGTRSPGFEQSDVFVYLVSLGLPGSFLAPSVLVTGHADGLNDRFIAGNEELAEVRLRVRGGRRFWIQAEGIRGAHGIQPGVGRCAVGGNYALMRRP